MSCQKYCCSSRDHLQIKHVVLKQLELQQAILMRLLSSGSLTEAISRISTMNEIADANNKMLQEQNVIKKILHRNKKKTTMLSILLLQTNSN